MRSLKLLAATAAVVAATVSVPSAARAASGTTFTFDLGRGDTAVAPVGGLMAAPGDSIKVTGSGTFDPVAQTVDGNGAFVHYAAGGTVMCRGTWKATGFASFTDFGPVRDREGGSLALVVTHYCPTMGMTMTGLPMTATSALNAPPGYVAGVTVGDFTLPIGGSVIIEAEQ